MSNSEQPESPHPEALKTLAQLQIERLKREDEEEQWISGEELYTEGSSEEDDVALKRRSAGKVPRKNLKGAIAKERKHGMRKSHVRPASASPSRLHTESTKLFTGPELALPESQLQHLSLSRPDELPRAERNYEESCDHPKQGTSSSSSAQRMETDEEQPEISWRPKRGSIKLPNLTPEGNAKTSELEDADVSYLEVLEDLKKLQSSNRASIIQEIAVSKEIESRIEDISIQKEERFDIEPVHDLQWDFLVEDDGDENLKSAFLKMNKLDALLQFTEDKEREAREETQSMQLQVREELEQLSECHGPYITELTKNTVSFLQLCPVPRNGGNIEDKPVPKMIHSDKSDTDILNQDIANNLNHNVEEIVSEKQETTLFKTEPQLLDKTDTSGINKGISKNISKPKKEKPDFILRNIKLASEGLGTLSITDAEKQKLAELLKDLDNDSDIKDHSLVVKNQLDGVSGYSMDPEIQQLLEEIDLKLEIVSTKNQFQGSNSRTSSIKETKITPKDALVEDNIHSWKVAEERQRLIEIDESLTIFNGPMKEEIDPLEDEELHRLVEYCSTHCSTAFGDESSKLNSDMCFAVSNSQLVPATTLTDNVLTQLVQQAMKFMPYFKFRNVV